MSTHGLSEMIKAARLWTCGHKCLLKRSYTTIFPHSRFDETYDPAFHGDVGKHPYLRKLKYRKLGATALHPSNISFGTGYLGSNLFGAYERTEEIITIQEGIRNGINYIDTAPWYGNSEIVLGEALKGIPRHTYYLATKVGRNYTPTWKGRFDFSAGAVLKNVERSLERLGVDHVDIIQVHDIEFAEDLNQIVTETLPALYSVVRAGKAKYVGITAYDIKPLKTVAEQAHVDTILSYCRYNLHDMTLLDYLQFFEDKNIGIINASAVAMGLLTSKGPPAWHPALPETKELATRAVSIAQERGTTLEDVALQFSLQPPQRSIATTLVGMPNRQMLIQNLNAAIRSQTSADLELFKEFCGLFGNKNHHWEGVEVEQMKRELSRQK